MTSVEATVERLEGDHYNGRSGKRHVTLIQSEHLDAIASYLGIESVSPEQLRRNIVVRGINLLALRDRTVSVGEAILGITDICAPCSRMEETFGAGGYNAVRGHGGVTARILQPGLIRIGDEVAVEQF